MKILVTGGTGFLGQQVVSRLVAAGHHVRVLARTATPPPTAPLPVQPRISAPLPAAKALAGSKGEPFQAVARASGEIDWMQGDVTDALSMKRALAGIDVVYHLAGLVSFRPDDARKMYALHVEGTRLLLEAAASAQVKRVVLASTSGTVAVSKEDRLGTEDDEYPLTVVSRWPYYLSKIYEEKLALSFCQQRQLPLIVLNPSLLMGPGDDRLSSTWVVSQFLNREIPTMPSGGLSLVDVRDIADAFVAALTRGEVYGRHLMGVNLSFADFFGRLERLTGVPAPLVKLPRGMAQVGAQLLKRWADLRGTDVTLEPQSVDMAEHFFYLDASKAERLLGFRARELQETLFDTVNDLMAKIPPQSLPGTKGRLRTLRQE